MRKGALVFAILFLISIFAVAGVLADENANVQNAYVCLETQINKTGCSSLSIEDKIFSVLATGNCSDSLIKDMTSNYCWPPSKGGSVCNLRYTAEAVLALKGVGANVSNSVTWLMNQKGVSTDLNWFWEIDNTNNNKINCQITYRPNPTSGTQTYVVSIGADKKISQNAGGCLTLANNNYWFSVSPSCYGGDFQVACDDPSSGGKASFASALIYQKKGSSTYYISDQTQSSSGSPVSEKINSECFQSGGVCDYLGTLWTSTVLQYLEKSGVSGNILVSDTFPYLTTLDSNNAASFPDSFLYILTNSVEYRTNILNKQVFSQFWDVTGKGNIYDTALALLPFQNDNTLPEKQDTKKWLFGYNGISPQQKSDGCFVNDAIIPNAFLLYSLWPRNNIIAPPVPHLCIDSDGGKVWNASGTVSVDGTPQGTDFCTNNTLTEYYCNLDNSSFSVNVTCVDGCSAGACNSNRIGNLPCSSANFSCISSGVSCGGTVVPYYTCTGNDVCCDPTPIDDGGNNNNSGNQTQCAAAGYTCTSSSACSSNSYLPSLDCGKTLTICCSNPVVSQTCSDLKGIVCSSSEYCSGGNSQNTVGLGYLESCCLSPGTCVASSVNNQSSSSCLDNLGLCQSSCPSGYVSTSSYSCSSSTDLCCVQNSNPNPPANGSYWWIWVLFILIVIIVVGILYRDKIKEFIEKARAGKSRKGGMGAGLSPMGPGLPPRFPPSYNREPRMGAPVRRKITPPEERRPEPNLPKKNSPKELDEVLKKLKEIGK